MQRASLLMLESRHEDNPMLYTADGQLTEQGKKTMAVLDALTGVRYQRLRLGRWVNAEGAVYEFDASVNLIDSFPIPAEWRKIRSTDFGYSNPFVTQWWAIDPDGRMYLYRELYGTQRIVEDWAADIKRLSEGETIEATVADHDAEDRATLERHEVPTVPANKEISPGIQAVQARLRKAGDKKARLFVMRGALVAADPGLLELRKPVNTEQEFDVYMWPKGADGKALKEKPVDEYNHGMDAARYAVRYVDGPLVTTMPNPFYD
jgi:phage terminase large subunit